MATYQEWALPPHLLAAWKQKADLLWDRGTVLHEPNQIFEAASTYGEARIKAKEWGLALQYAQLSFQQARALTAAASDGATNESASAVEILFETLDYLEGLGEDKTPAVAELERRIREYSLELP